MYVLMIFSMSSLHTYVPPTENSGPHLYRSTHRAAQCSMVDHNSSLQLPPEASSPKYRLENPPCLHPPKKEIGCKKRSLIRTSSYCTPKPEARSPQYSRQYVTCSKSYLTRLDVTRVQPKQSSNSILTNPSATKPSLPTVTNRLQQKIFF